MKDLPIRHALCGENFQKEILPKAGWKVLQWPWESSPWTDTTQNSVWLDSDEKNSNVILFPISLLSLVRRRPAVHLPKMLGEKYFPAIQDAPKPHALDQGQWSMPRSHLGCSTKLLPLAQTSHNPLDTSTPKPRNTKQALSSSCEKFHPNSSLLCVSSAFLFPQKYVTPFIILHQRICT